MKQDSPTYKPVRMPYDFVIGEIYSLSPECWDQHYYKEAAFEVSLWTPQLVRSHQLGVLKNENFLVVDVSTKNLVFRLKILLLNTLELCTIIPTIADNRYWKIT